MNLQEWYGGIQMNMPTSFNDFYGFKQFISKASGFFGAVMAEQFDGHVQIAFSNDEEVSTAAADIENRKIIFGEKLFRRENRTFPSATTAQVTELVMGTTLHECLHFKYTIQSIEGLCSFFGREADMLLGRIFNIVEDIYIDSKGYEDLEHYRWLTDSRLATMFTQSSFDETVTKWGSDSNSYTNALVHLKNFNLTIPSGPELWTELSRAALSVKSMDDIIDRFRLAMMIRDRLESEMIENGQDPQESTGQGGDPVPVEIESFTRAMEASEKIEKASFGTGSISRVNFSGNCPVIFTRAESEEFEKVFTMEAGHFNTNVQYEVDARYVGLSRLIAARSQVNRPYGLQSNRGTHIRQLHRIATDGKVLTKRVQTESVGPQEIILLVDLSGSMMGVSPESLSTKLSKAMGAVLGAARGLESGRHRVAVYGHTADLILATSEEQEQGRSMLCAVIEFKAFSESCATLEKRLDWFADNAHKIIANNADSYAITRVAQEFSSLSNSKTLIVISDGDPSAYAYSGSDDGKKVTKKAVNEVRNSGKRVLSISIDMGAYKPNNEIYGEENNLKNYSPNVVIDILTKMFS